MKTIYTIGHSTRTIEEFVALLKQNGVEVLVDIRRFPGSKRYPHFGREQLPLHLADAGIGYRHEEALGGRRKPAEDSPNRVWRNAQFKAYADHMSTPEFEVALGRLLADAESTVQVIMCAEAVPWRCHRQLTSDAILARGGRVRHIISDAEPKEHTLFPAARIGSDGQITYPAPNPQMDLL